MKIRMELRMTARVQLLIVFFFLADPVFERQSFEAMFLTTRDAFDTLLPSQPPSSSRCSFLH